MNQKMLVLIILCFVFSIGFSQNIYKDFLKSRKLKDISNEDNTNRLKQGYLIMKARSSKYLYAIIVNNEKVKIIDSVEATPDRVNFGRVFFDSKDCFFWAQSYKLLQPIYGKIVYKSDSLKSIDHLFFIDTDRNSEKLLFTNAGREDPKFFYLMGKNILDTFVVNQKLFNLRYYRLKKIEQNKLYLAYIESDEPTTYIMSKK
jgi:hypothetical protein